jgi:hypothetical protein
MNSRTIAAVSEMAKIEWLISCPTRKGRDQADQVDGLCIDDNERNVAVQQLREAH